MEVNKILSADVLDIVFEGRNKEYGAYLLRRTYSKRIKLALVATISAVALLLLLSFLFSKQNDDDSRIKQTEMTIQEVKQEDKKEPPPPPPPQINASALFITNSLFAAKALLIPLLPF